jgi:hypothetical protein
MALLSLEGRSWLAAEGDESEPRKMNNAGAEGTDTGG